MDFNATIDLIIKDLREASDIIDDLKKYPGFPIAGGTGKIEMQERRGGYCIA